jgi:hypothetical protein
MLAQGVPIHRMGEVQEIALKAGDLHHDSVQFLFITNMEPKGCDGNRLSERYRQSYWCFILPSSPSRQSQVTDFSKGLLNFILVPMGYKISTVCYES